MDYIEEPVKKYFDILFYYHSFENNISKENKIFTKMDLEEVRLTKNLKLIPDPLKNLIWLNEDDLNEEEEGLEIKKSEEEKRKEEYERLLNSRKITFTIDETGKDSRFSYNTKEDQLLRKLKARKKKKKNNHFFSDLAMISKAAKDKFLKLNRRRTLSSNKKVEEEIEQSDNVFDNFHMSTKENVNGALSYLKKKYYKRNKIKFRSTFSSNNELMEGRRSRMMSTGGEFLGHSKRARSLGRQRMTKTSTSGFRVKKVKMNLDRLDSSEGYNFGQSQRKRSSYYAT